MAENGRKTALTPQVHATIVEALRRGNTREDASAIARITSRTLRNWMSRGEAEDAEEFYASFAADVLEAETDARTKMIDEIRLAAGKDWKAAAWYLERRDPNWREHRNASVEMTGKDGGPLGLGVIVLPPEQVEDAEDETDEAGPNGSVDAESRPPD
jgi:hypothetical protein